MAVIFEISANIFVTEFFAMMGSVECFSLGKQAFKRLGATS